LKEPIVAGSRKALVLLVDDCEETRSMYAEVLGLSFEIAQASTGREALAKASELRPHAIVMDLMLPDMGGEDAIYKLRHDGRTREIPIVVLSGSMEPLRKTPAWSLYLLKPCRPDALSRQLDRIIGVPRERSAQSE
jgi:CheY-like chemotaxis protein